MDFNDVIDELAAQARTIVGLRVYDHPTDAVTQPSIVFPLPEDIQYDKTYGRGMDRCVVSAILLVAKPSNRAARRKIVEYVNGSGDRSIKAVLEAGAYTAFDDIFVATADPDVITVGTADYLAYQFRCDIAGRGAQP